jgi:hypothetical protein
VAWEVPPSTYLSGNTAGTTYVHGNPVTLVGGANITVSGSGNQIVIKGGAGGAGGTGPSISAGTQSTDGGTVFFANSNGVTFGMAGSSKITATVKTDYLTAQTAYSFADSNGISWGTNGSTVTGTVKTDYLTTARRSTDAIGLNTAQTNIVWTVNSSGLSIDAGAHLTTARASNDAIGLNTAKTNVTWTVNSSGLSLDAGGYLTTARASNDAVGLNTAKTNVTWTVNSSGLSLDLGAHLTTARASNDAIGLNTAKTNVTWTANSSGLSLDAGGYAGTVTGATGASLTVNTAGVSVNLPAYLTTARASNDAVGLNTAKTAVTWTVNSSGISIDAGAYLTTARGSTDAIGLNTAQTNVTWTANSSGLSLNAGGYAGTVTGATNCSVTANTSGVSVKVSLPTLSYWENPNIDGMTSWSGTSNSISIQRIYIPAQISATRADFLLNISGSSSGALSFRVNLGLYTATRARSTAPRRPRDSSASTAPRQSATRPSPGPRSWSIGLGTWNMTPGEYFLAMNMGWTTASTNTVFIAPYGNGSIAVISGGETGAFANRTDYFRTAMINSGAQSTLPNTMQLVDMTQTGASVQNQPWIGFHGTF